MVVNCLPLFSLPGRDELQETLEDSAADHASNGGGGHEAGKESRGTPEDTVTAKSDWVQFSESHSRLNGGSSPLNLSTDPIAGALPPNLTNSVIIPSEVSTFEDNFTPDPEDIFSTVDPFTQPTTGVGEDDLLLSTREKALEEAFNQAGGGGGEDSDDYLGGSPISHDEIAVSFVEDIRPLKQRCGSVSFVGARVVTSDEKLGDSQLGESLSDHQSSPLPSPPPVFLPRYVERGGWAMKLSHRKGKNALSSTLLKVCHLLFLLLLLSFLLPTAFSSHHSYLLLLLLLLLPPPPPLCKVLLPAACVISMWYCCSSGVFGDRWQRRYFVLNGPTLSYFKKYGVSVVTFEAEMSECVATHHRTPGLKGSSS